MTLFDHLLASPAAQLSGERCQAHVARLSHYHRIIGSPGYRAALDYVYESLARMQGPELSVESYPIDGATAYGDWIAPAAWKAWAGELWLEQPERLRLCDYRETPVCLHPGSQSTPPGGLEAELIDVGSGLTAQDYSGLAVPGNLVLASGNVSQVYQEAVRRRGAAGVISDHMPWPVPAVGRTPAGQPDLVSYNKLDVRREDIGQGGFSFAVSARQGAYLRRLLGQGPVRLWARVKARAFAGHMEVLSGFIPGAERPDQELVLVAHLCHPRPGANDNATGPALILELVRSLLAAWQAGKLPRLRHSLRLLFVPEAYGTIAWLLNDQARPSRPRLALNLDMVGANSSLTGGYVRLDQTPWSLPTYLNDLVAVLLGEAAAGCPGGWPFGVQEHMGGSDHILFLAPEFGIPALMLGHQPDRFYHSDQDTVDKTDPVEFERIGRVVMATLLAVDFISAGQARRLAHLVCQAAAQRLVSYSQQTMQAGLEPGDYPGQMAVLLAKEQAALRSIVSHTCPDDQAAAAAETEVLSGRLARLCAAQVEIMGHRLGPARIAAPAGRDSQVPRRLFRGPLSTPLMGLSRFHETMGARAEFYHQRAREDLTFVRWMFEASNLIDGRRTVGQIQAVLAAEFGQAAAPVEQLYRLVDDLVTAGMATVSEE